LAQAPIANTAIAQHDEARPTKPSRLEEGSAKLRGGFLLCPSSARTLKTVGEGDLRSQFQVLKVQQALVIIGLLEEFDPPYLHPLRGCFGSLFCVSVPYVDLRCHVAATRPEHLEDAAIGVEFAGRDLEDGPPESRADDSPPRGRRSSSSVNHIAKASR
jgi:hypothetical protein